VNHKTERYRRQFKSKDEAKAWVAESKARLLRGEPVDLSEHGDHAKGNRAGLPHTLSDLIEYVYENHWKPMPSGEKARYNGHSITKIIGPNLPIAKLSRMDVDKARTALLATGNSPATVNRKVAALSKALSIYRDDNPAYAKPKITKYSVAEGRIRRFSTEEEIAALGYFDHIGQADMADYVILSLDTGMRQGEVMSMRFQDCLGDRATVWGAHAKSGKTRTIPLTKRAQGVIARRFKDTGEDQRGPVFPNLNRWGIAHYWRRFAAAMKLQDDKEFVPHIMRHEFCSRLADRGLNAAIIKELAGHSTLQVTQRYIRVGAQSLVDAIALLNAKPNQSPLAC
jgi:integrase